MKLDIVSSGLAKNRLCHEDSKPQSRTKSPSTKLARFVMLSALVSWWRGVVVFRKPAKATNPEARARDERRSLISPP